MDLNNIEIHTSAYYCASLHFSKEWNRNLSVTRRTVPDHRNPTVLGLTLLVIYHDSTLMTMLTYRNMPHSFLTGALSRQRKLTCNFTSSWIVSTII